MTPPAPKPLVGAGPAASLDPLAVLMGVGFAFMWSSAFSSAKVALIDAPPLTLLAVRFLLAGGLTLIAALLMGQRPPARWVYWRRIALLGVCQNSLYLGLFFVAMTRVPAGLASIIASTMPLLVAAAGPLFFKERVGRLGALGLALGFGGTLFILQDRLGGDLGFMGLSLCLIGVAALAGATLLVRHAELGSGLLMVVGLQMLIGGAVLAPFALAFESVFEVNPTLPLLLAFLYTTFIPGIAATLVWFSLIRRIGAAKASAYHFLNPAFGVAVAHLLLGEPVGTVDLVGVAVVAVGILMVQLGRV